MKLYGFSLQLFSELLDFCEFYKSQHFAVPRSIFAVVSHMIFFHEFSKNYTPPKKKENMEKIVEKIPLIQTNPPQFARSAVSHASQRRFVGSSKRQAPFQEGAGHVLHGLGMAGNQTQPNSSGLGLGIGFR